MAEVVADVATDAATRPMAAADEDEQANQYGGGSGGGYGGGGGRCRYGCCGYGLYGRCRRCCMNANEAKVAQIAEKNKLTNKQNLIAHKDDEYGGGWGGWGGGWSGGPGGGYGWGGGPGGGGYGWGGPGGGGGYGWGGGHGGCPKYGCCGGYYYHGGCKRCCYNAQEAQSMQNEAKP